MMNLTTDQRVFEFVQDYLRGRGYPPSSAEIFRKTGVCSADLPNCYKRLERQRLIRRGRTGWRNTVYLLQ